MTGKFRRAALGVAAAALCGCGGTDGFGEVAVFDDVPAGAPVGGTDAVGPAPLAPANLNPAAPVTAETQSDGRRAAVTVAGGAGTSYSDVEQGLLLNAARIAEARGAPYFALDERSSGVDLEPAYAASTAAGRDFGRASDITPPNLNSGWGPSVAPIGPVGPYIPGGGVAPAAGTARAYEAAAVVTPLYERPEGRADVFATAEVLARLAPVDEAPAALR